MNCADSKEFKVVTGGPGGGRCGGLRSVYRSLAQEAAVRARVVVPDGGGGGVRCEVTRGGERELMEVLVC